MSHWCVPGRVDSAKKQCVYYWYYSNLLFCLMIIFGLLVFYVFGCLVINLVVWFSIYSVLRIRSNGPAWCVMIVFRQFFMSSSEKYFQWLLHICLQGFQDWSHGKIIQLLKTVHSTSLRPNPLQLGNLFHSGLAVWEWTNLVTAWTSQKLKHVLTHKRGQNYLICANKKSWNTLS